MSATIAAAANAGAAAPVDRLPFGMRMAYGFGAVANGVKNAAFSTYLLLYYNQVIGVPATIVSTAIALTLLVDAIADPVIGRWSDTTRSRWGRRHPFIYGAAVPTALFFAIAWYPPSGMSDLQTGIWIFCTAALTRVSISAFEIPTSAMTPELTEDYHERTKLFSLRYWFGYLGTFGFAAFALAVFFRATPEYPRGQLNPAGYEQFALLGAGLILLSMLVCGIGTHARIPKLRQADAIQDDGGRRGLGAHFSETWQAFRHPGFLALFMFGVLKYTAVGLYSATNLYFGTYLFGLNAAELAILTIDSFVAATIAMPLAPIVSRWFGKRACAMGFAIVGVSIGVVPLVLAYFGLFLPPGHPLLVPVLFAVGAIYGAMVAISLIMTASMLADVVEDSAVETGRHSAGTFFAASSFMAQCSTGLGIFAAGFVLTGAGFPAKVDPAAVTPEMTQALIAHYLPVSLGLWVIGALFLFGYRIDSNRHAANVERLRAREAQAMEATVRDAPLGGPAR